MRRVPVGGLLLLALLVVGCRKAKIDAPTEPLEPSVEVKKLPAAREPSKEKPWYGEMMPTKLQDKKPDGKMPTAVERPWASVETTIHEPENAKEEKPEQKEQPEEKPALPVTAQSARADAQVLVEELEARIKAARGAKANWCLLRLELNGQGAGRKAGLVLTADVGLTDLYVQRPEILFEQLRFEDCMNRLARMAGMRYAQERRWGNPLVTWRGENLSVYDTVRAITEKHGFAARFAAGGTRMTFDLSKYDTRDAFLAEVTRMIVEQGSQLRTSLPTMIISLAPKSSSSEKDGNGEGKGEPEKTGTVNEKKE